MSGEASAIAESHVHSRRFYFYLALTCLAIAVLGFMPSYFAPLAQGRFEAPPVVHLHGWLFFGWTALFTYQSWLVSEGRIARHRSLGLLGIALMTAMVMMVVVVVATQISIARLPSQPPGVLEGRLKFSWVSIGTLLFLVPVFVLAIVHVARPEVHRRLMLLATVSLLGAPIARWFIAFLAPPRPADAPPLPAGVMNVEAPPILVALAPSLLGDLVLAAAIVFDLRTRGRVHPVLVFGGGALLLLHLTSPLVGESDAWIAAADWIGRLAG